MKRFGAGRGDGVLKAEDKLRKYAFLEWINPYVAARDSISNLHVLLVVDQMSMTTMVMKSLRRKKMMKVMGKKVLKEMITKSKPKLMKEKSKAKSRI